MPGGGGSPQTFSRGGNPAAYIPTAQPQMDQLFQSTIGGFPTSPQGTPAGSLYPNAMDLYQELLNPFAASGQANRAQALGGAQLGAQLGQQAAPQLASAGGQLLATGMDPQDALFNRMRAQTLDNSAVTNSMAGLGGTPYGSSVAANNLNNFDINWQNNALQRQATAAGAALPLLTQAPTLAATSAALPTTVDQQAAQTAFGGIGSTVGIGNNQYALPQQVLNDIESYLGLGQSATGQALSGGQLGFNQTAQGLGGLLSGANTLFGGGGSGGLLGSAFGGGASGFGSGIGSGFASLPLDAQLPLISGGLDTAAATAAFDAPAAAAFAAPVADTGGAGFLSALAPAAAS